MSCWNSIVIGKKRLVGIRGYFQEEKIIVEEYRQQKRISSEIIQLPEISTFISRLVKKDDKVCLVKEGPFRHAFIQIAPLHKFEIKDMLSYHEGEYVGWEEKTPFFTQFLHRNPSRYVHGPEARMDLFMVSLRQHDVIELAESVIPSCGQLEIISYWTGELSRICQDQQDAVLVLLDEKTVTLQYWDAHMLIDKKQCSRTDWLKIGSILEKWQKKSLELQETGVAGIRIFLLDGIEKIPTEETENWKQILSEFGELSLRQDLHFCPQVEANFDINNATDAVALGGLVRAVTAKSL